MNKSVILKQGREKALRNRHHWIFSGAVKDLPAFSDGDILSVYSSEGKLLGEAYFNHKSNIIGRFLSFDDRPGRESLTANMERAFKFRKALFFDSPTNAFRLINAEGDAIPGLTVDCYADVLVMQVSTLGMEKLKTFIIPQLIDLSKKFLGINLKAVYERSDIPSRKEEGLPEAKGLLFGKEEAIQNLRVKEHGLNFQVSVKEGQKTGFFLDHREMRQLVRSLVEGKKVLNCFGYSGAFTVYALAGGADRVDTVEISAKALEMTRQNILLNRFNPDQQGLICADVFEFLREQEISHTFVVLDPPAFAKKRSDVMKACRGYKDINRLAMQKMPASSFLLTCSCSFHVDEELFRKVLFQAAVEAGRSVRIIGRHMMAADHPVNIFHPESDYLKSFLLYVD